MRVTTLFLSFLPLMAWLSGYLLSVYFFSKPVSEVPQLTGLTLAQALIRVGQKGLSLKILGEKHEPHAQPGTILLQRPQAGMQVKPNQSVFVVIAQEQPAMVVPNFQGMDLDKAQIACQNLGVTPAIVRLHYPAPLGTCMAQVPATGRTMDGAITLYFSAGEQPLRIMPNFVGYPADEVQEFLQGYGIAVTLVDRYFEPDGLDIGTVLAQKPSAGSCVDLKKATIVQLVVLSHAR